MSLTLRFQTRRELLQQMVPRYRGASTVQKGALLDEIAATTEYSRRYAMWLLNHLEEGRPPPGPRRQRRYGPEVQHALFLTPSRRASLSKRQTAMSQKMPRKPSSLQ